MNLFENLQMMKEVDDKYYSICLACNYHDNIEADTCPNCGELLIPCSQYEYDMYIQNNYASTIPRYVLFLNVDTEVLGLADYGQLTTKAPSPTADIKYVTKSFFDHLCHNYKNVLIHDDTPNKSGPGGIKFICLSKSDKHIINVLFGSSI